MGLSFGRLEITDARPQFTFRALLVAMLVVAAFFGGIRFERELEERRRKQDLGNRYYDQVRPPRSPLIVEIFDPTGEWPEAE